MKSTSRFKEIVYILKSKNMNLGEEIISLKVLIVGEPGVGKTSLANRYVNNTFSTKYKSTIGCDFANKTIQWSDNLKIDIHFWDLAGQDRLNNQVKVYYREADGALCVCDVTRQETRAQVLKWKDTVIENSTRKDGTQINPPCIMLINKVDLIPDSKNSDDIAKDSEKLVDIYEAPKNLNDEESFYETGLTPDLQIDKSDMIESFNKLALDSGFIAGIPTSAKDGMGIDTSLKILIEQMLVNREHNLAKGIYNKSENIVQITPIPITETVKKSAGWCSC